MAILGINCATESISLAIVGDDSQVYESDIAGQTKQAENLLQMIDNLLQKANITLDNISKIGIAIGPGAFTGLRLSLVTAKTIALAKKIPLVAISTLEGLAHQHKHEISDNNNIRIVLDACRGEVSTATFNSQLKRLSEDIAIKEAEIETTEKETIIKATLAKALPIAEIARDAAKVFDHNKIIALAPFYSHQARVNKTTKKELQHLKIGEKS